MYIAASLGIILDPLTRTQKFFGGGEERLGKIKPPVGFYGHSNDVVCLAMSDDRKKVATGQVGV